MKTKLALLALLVPLASHAFDGFDRDGVHVRPERPGRPGPVRPVPPRGDYGPGWTARWQEAGSFKVPKAIREDIVVRVGGQYVNEVLLYVDGGTVDISSAYAYLSNGQAFPLRRLTGSFRENSEVRSLLARDSSLRIDRIVFQAMSPNLIGSRGRLSVVLGLAY